jgi:GntR family transcriptional repressor for pyruvate dehydrogenase complex
MSPSKPAAAKSSKRPIVQWRSARSESAAQRIERQIKTAVLAREFQCGDYLGSEHELSAQLGVSRLPVREALGRLQALGLVEVRTGAGGGARVASGDPGRIGELLAIQLILEGIDAEQVLVAQRIIEVAAVGMAARYAQPEHIEQMEQALVEAERLVEQPDRFTAAAMAFHAAVGRGSRNRFLSIMMQAIAVALEQVTAPDTTVEVARSVVARHRKLLCAIRSGDQEAALNLIARHLDRVHAHVRARLGRNHKGRHGRPTRAS